MEDLEDAWATGDLSYPAFRVLKEAAVQLYTLNLPDR